MEKHRISNKIRKYRFHFDEMTQEQLADKVGVTRQTIVAIEKAKYSPSLELAFRIAQVFESPLEDVFKYDEKQPAAKTTTNDLFNLTLEPRLFNPRMDDEL
jgi:putative transcriptional regulator